MDETRRRDERDAEPGQSDEAIKDLEVEEQDTEGVMGGVPAVQDFTITKTTDASTPKLN
jgi:hypothetical protein